MQSFVVDTSLVRFLAIILITNSHLDRLYPDPRFATGGGLGNALFFALSGFGLAMSARKQLPSLNSWLSRRLLNIYPQVALATLLLATLSSVADSWPPAKLFHYFIWPTNYWFVAAIVTFYIPIYITLKYFSNAIRYIIFIFIAPYLFFYYTELSLTRFSIEDDPFRWLFYFQVMLFGAHLASSDTLTKHRKSDGVVLLFIIACYFIIKLLLSKGIFKEFQFFIHLITFPFVLFSLRFFSNPDLLDHIKKFRLYSFIAFLGQLSLEVYLVQGFLIRWVAETGVNYIFSILIIWPVVFLAAWPLSLASKRMVDLLSVLWSRGLSGAARIRNEQ